MKRIVLVLALLIAIFAVGVSVALANTTYIPLVYRESTPTPTPTPTATPIPGPILLPNGDFEHGHVNWIEYSNHGYDLIRYRDSLQVSPHGGGWAVWMGGANNDVDKLHQMVVIPPDHPYLSFWLLITSTDTCNNDFVYVYLGNTKIDKHDLCYDHRTNGWVQYVYDLRAFSGQNVDLILSVETNGTYPSSIYLDDFEFQTSLTP